MEDGVQLVEQRRPMRVAVGRQHGRRRRHQDVDVADVIQTLLQKALSPRRHLVQHLKWNSEVNHKLNRRLPTQSKPFSSLKSTGHNNSRHFYKEAWNRQRSKRNRNTDNVVVLDVGQSGQDEGGGEQSLRPVGGGGGGGRGRRVGEAAVLVLDAVQPGQARADQRRVHVALRADAAQRVQRQRRQPVSDPNQSVMVTTNSSKPNLT